MKSKSKTIVRVLMVVVAVVSVLMILDYIFTPSYDPITVRVIDAESKKPIKGAVIMAEWIQTKGLGLTYHPSYRVIEVKSNSKGETVLQGIPRGKARLDVVAVYKKGYVLWSNHNVFAGSRMLTNFEWKNNYVFEMARFKPEYSYLKHTRFISSAIRGSSNKQ